MPRIASPLLRNALGAWKNFRLGNRVDYSAVALGAQLGRSVQVMAGASVDEHSSLGSYTYVGFRSSVSRAQVGRYVSIANNVSIRPGEHSLTGLATSTVFSEQPYDELTAKPLILGSDVWVGVDSIVRRGVTVGDGAVIGANSFVNEDVPPFAIVAGSPARLVRYRFPKAARELLLRERWWERELPEARGLLRELEARIAKLPAEDAARGAAIDD